MTRATDAAGATDTARAGATVDAGDISDTALVRQRLANQRLGREGAAGGGSPAELVRWMGAVQAQDFAGGVWAVGLRCTPSGFTYAGRVPGFVSGVVAGAGAAGDEAVFFRRLE